MKRNFSHKAEEGLKKMEFPLLSIFRPGAIDRRPTDRLNERIARNLLNTDQINF